MHWNIIRLAQESLTCSFPSWSSLVSLTYIPCQGLTQLSKLDPHVGSSWCYNCCPTSQSPWLITSSKQVLPSTPVWQQNVMNMMMRASWGWEANNSQKLQPQFYSQYSIPCLCFSLSSLGHISCTCLFASRREGVEEKKKGNLEAVGIIIMPATIESWATMNVCSVFQLYRKVTWAFEDSERCRPKIDLKVMRLTVHNRACEVAFTVALRVVSYIIAKSPKLSPAPLVLNNKKGSFPYKCWTYTTDQALAWERQTPEVQEQNLWDHWKLKTAKAITVLQESSRISSGNGASPLPSSPKFQIHPHPARQKTWSEFHQWLMPEKDVKTDLNMYN